MAAQTVPEAVVKPPGRPYRWLLVLPFVWQVGLVAVVNDVDVYPLNLPFPMFWQMLGVALTTVVIGIVFWLDRRSGVEDEEAAFLHSCDAAEGAGHTGGEH